ncbi:MAG: general secretion pathway protein GspK, partial [Planctomycetales bacterium]|nr:general secretion pathway protein GspK [Planctomycetales bacterium]
MKPPRTYDDRHKLSRRRAIAYGKLGRRRGFILLLVLVVVAIASLAALTFSRSMLISHEAARISTGQLQTRMCAESGAQAVRLMLAYPPTERLGMGGTWDNAAMFQAINVIPDSDPARRAHYTIISPSLDEAGYYTGLRYGLQNESAKLNLNALAQLDALASAGTMAAAAVGGSALGGAASGAGSSMSSLASLAADDNASPSMASSMLMALPGMTEDVADAILDWLDEDEEPRPMGAEFDDYYLHLPNPYKPNNGPIESIEQLLLVRGVTPQLLFGYDENRNGVLDAAESTRMSRGTPAGSAPGSLPAMSSDPNIAPPPPLGWAPYLTLQSLEKNVAADGTQRVNINSDDMQLLSEELSAVLQNEDWSSFILAYRYGGAPGGSGTSPLVALASMAAADSEQTDGALGAQLQNLNAAQGNRGAGNTGAAASQVNGAPPPRWTADQMSSIDLTQAGSVKFNQVLDLIDATVTINGSAGAVTYASPLSSLPLDLANSTPQLMDYLTTVDAPATPGRINIMECPQEILRGIPGLTDEMVDQILEARGDGSDSPTRQFETWLAVEGIVTMDQMRAILPLVTCGGDVFKAQIVGYIEGGAAFSR